MSNYVKTGLCFFCLREIETDQARPTEAYTRHIDDQTPYCGESSNKCG